MSVIGLIRRLVEAEDPAAVNRVLIAELQNEAICELHGSHLLCRWRAGASRQILALGHSDTVWPKGTLRSMPFREEDGRLWGPGVLDMKGGLAIFIEAMRRAGPHNVLLQVNSDEETGSRDSRGLTETNARDSRAVLVLEPAAGPEGRLKTARKGTGVYTIVVTGIAAHAGLDFEKGSSAIVELARQIERLASQPGLNPGVIRGGTRPNVVAAEASVEVDVRVATLEDAARVESFMHCLRPFDSRCRITVTGGLNRPPMKRQTELFELARNIDPSLQEASVGGGSDGNFTAALGVPTLDGLGAIGEGAHANHESIVIDRLEPRIDLVAKLIRRIASQPS